MHSLRCLLGDGLRGEGLGIPSLPSWVPLGALCASCFGHRRPCVYTAQVPAVLRERGGASDSVPRQSAPTFVVLHRRVRAVQETTVQFFDVVYVPTVVRRQVPEMVQTVQKIVECLHTFMDKVV